jgi:hypothetical protein
MDILANIKNNVAIEKRSRLWIELTEAEKQELLPEVYDIYNKLMIKFMMCLS